MAWCLRLAFGKSPANAKRKRGRGTTMNHVLLWKEYRQQRAVWLAIALLGIFLVVVLGLAMGQGSGLEVFRDNTIRRTLLMIVSALVLAHGVVCGALLLAGE